MSDDHHHTDGPVAHIPVVIVGGGPTGVTAATLLAQYGVESLVLERWPGVYSQPRAVHLDDEIYRVIARLGIADEFAAISRPTLGLRLLDRGFRVLAEFNRDPAGGIHGFPQANMFDQPELEAILRANLNRHPAARLRGGAEVTAIANHGTRVRVTFADRSDGSTHLVDADYVLGCDGANSLVRAQIGSSMRELNFEQRWLVVDVATDADLRQWDGVHQVCDPARAGTYMRIGASRYRWEFQLLAGESADDFGTVGALLPLIEPWTGHVDDDALSLLRVAEYTFRAQIADRWRGGVTGDVGVEGANRNVFLLGDAAHLTPPFIGQGMGAGVRDAANLSWKIAGVHHGTLGAGALDSYEQERKPHTRQMIALALNVGRAMTGGGRLGDLARSVIAPRLRWIPGVRDKVVDSTTPALRHSALIVKTLRPHQLAGRLCPNLLLPNGNRLDDALGAGFALVTAVPLAAADERLLRLRAVEVLVAAPESELGRWLRHGRADAALIRPDHTVMRAGRDTAALVAWFTTLAPRSPASELSAPPRC